METVKLLVISVATLFCFIAIGFVLKKTKIVGSDFAKAMSLLTLYVTQISLFVYSYILPFDKNQVMKFLAVGIGSFAIHTVFFLIAKNLFGKAPDKTRKLATYSVIFSNAGYMGIPLIEDTLGPEYAIYATVYLIAFNVFSFTVGRLIFTEDKSYISIKKIFINPAVIPIGIGLILYITGAGGWIYNAAISGGSDLISEICAILYKVMGILKNMVAPATMMMIGLRLADTEFKSILKDKYLYYTLLVRLILFPVLVWSVCRTLMVFGLINIDVLKVLVILASTPIAAAAAMFSELYDGDVKKAGGYVAISTLASIVTMPLVALLLNI